MMSEVEAICTLEEAFAGCIPREASKVLAPVLAPPYISIVREVPERFIDGQGLSVQLGGSREASSSRQWIAAMHHQFLG